MSDAKKIAVAGSERGVVTYSVGEESVASVLREADERHAWDAYAAACLPTLVRHGSPNWAKSTAEEAGTFADAMLEERRRRWGSR